MLAYLKVRHYLVGAAGGTRVVRLLDNASAFADSLAALRDCPPCEGIDINVGRTSLLEELHKTLTYARSSWPLDYHTLWSHLSGTYTTDIRIDMLGHELTHPAC
jgi:hypothetical protein